MTHARFLARRLVQGIPVVVGVTLVVFVLIHLVPGDPARTALGARATPQAIAQLHHEWGLDRSLPAQYELFLRRLLRGDLGTSLRYARSTASLIGERLPVTLWLIVCSTLLTCLLAVPLALLAASRPGATRDRLVRALSVIGLGVPAFWLGVVLIQYLGVEAQLLPAAGFGDGFSGHVRSMLLPSLTVAAGIVPLVVRSLRAEVLRVAESDYVVTARAKGLGERRIRLRHVLRNALAPSVTVLAVNVGFLVGATMVVERVFSLAGIGDLMLQSIDARDFPVVQGVTLVMALIVVAVNVLADLAQGFLDPRVELR
jgi:ABC-type dipeptide/oligopeptide/nickel transport system permease component